MATADPAQGSKAPLRTMSIARFISRFARPQLLTTNIPTYRQSFSHPIQETPDQAKDSIGKSATESNQEQSESSSASYIEWSKLLPVPSNLLGSFQHLFEGRAERPEVPGQESTAAPLANPDTVRSHSTPPPPRLVFFGEQHHQPHVMRAQLQTLHALYQQCQLASKPASAQSEHTPIYRLHLVLEHFSVLDQHMLNSFSHGQLEPDQLADVYHEHSQEAFHIGHYMPLLMLAKELHVPIWGGFPPRSWARQVFRDGVESVKPDEHRRANPSETGNASSLEPAPQPAKPASPQSHIPTVLPRPPLFTSWSAVTKIGAAHRSYLSGLMRPDLPPRFPQLPTPSPVRSDATHQTHSDEAQGALPIYPTWLLKPHIVETKGFGPAQALKDSYLAHVTAWILRGQHDSAQDGQDGQPPESLATLPALDEAPSPWVDDSNRPVVNIALVVCGLGHCEYGFGAPERVVQLLSEQGSSSAGDDTAALLPYIIASKPLDSGIWLGYEHPSQPSASNNMSAEQTSESERPKASKPAATDSEAVQRWLNDPWGRKMADAVLLYDWIDQEPAQEAGASADGHQPTSSSSS